MQAIWEYPDATDTMRRGVMLGFSDHGGTDVTYRFHRLDADGKPIEFDNGGRCVDCVSGSRLKRAHNITAQVIREREGN